MDNLSPFNTITEYNNFNDNEARHPLVSVVDLAQLDPRQDFKMLFGFYIVFQKEVKFGALVFSRDTNNYREGTLKVGQTPQNTAY